MRTCTCDKCGRVIQETEWEEYQEIHEINFSAGYGSVFGDTSHVHLDVCQHCLFSFIGAEFLEKEKAKVEHESMKECTLCDGPYGCQCYTRQ